MDEYQKHLATFLAAHEADPDAKGPYLQLANLCRHAGRTSEAIAWLERCLEKFPEDDFLRRRLEGLKAPPTPAPRVAVFAPGRSGTGVGAGAPWRSIGLAAGGLALLVAVGVMSVEAMSTFGPSSEVVAAQGLDNLSPSWSPDGRTIAYLRRTGPNTALSLHDVRSGRTEDLIAICEFCSLDLHWSPDSRTIAYVKYRTEELFQGSFIHLVDVASGAVLVLTPGEEPRWSPDGARLAFVAPDRKSFRKLLRGDRGTSYVRALEPGHDRIGGEICLVDRLTGEVTRLTGFPARAPRWSPTGDTIAFVHEKPGPQWIKTWSQVTGRSDERDELPAAFEIPSQTVGVVDVADRDTRTLTRDGMWGTLRWSPDGTRLLATRFGRGRHGPTGEGELWLIDVAAATQERLARQEKFVLSQGLSSAFLPDGDAVLFQAELLADPDDRSTTHGGHDIFYLGLEDRKPRRLPSEHLTKGDFSLSPDGRQMVYVTYPGLNVAEIWRTKVKP